MLKVRETYVNETEGHRFYESNWQDAGAETPGEIYRASLRAYGRCTSAIYRETDNGPVKVGWYFEALDRYQDTGEPYKRGVWVEYRTFPDPCPECAFGCGQVLRGGAWVACPVCHGAGSLPAA